MVVFEVDIVLDLRPSSFALTTFSFPTTSPTFTILSLLFVLDSIFMRSWLRLADILVNPDIRRLQKVDSSRFRGENTVDRAVLPAVHISSCKSTKRSTMLYCYALLK